MSTTEIITYVFAALGAVAVAANAASAFVPKDSTLGLWLAWVASMPIRHKPKASLPPKSAPTLLALLAVASVASAGLCSGCKALRSQDAWDAAQEICRVALTAREEIKAEADARSLTVGEWAALVCSVSDVIEPYVVETDEAKATPRAVEAAKARGLARETPANEGKSK